MKKNRFLLLVGLFILGAVLLISLSDLSRIQLKAFLNPHIHNHTHEHGVESGPRTVVNEALLRIPLPPTPDELRDSMLESGFATGTVKSEPLEKKYQRELPGVMSVKTAVNSLSECASRAEDEYGCYADYLTNTVETKSIEKAFVDLKAAYNAGDQQVISFCHQLTHIIGRAATKKFPTVAESYNYGDTFCWSGYYHGIMEAIILEMGIENVPKQLNDICISLPGRDTYSFNYFNCVHGLGHGLMYVENHELFDALVLCDGLEGEWEKSSCHGGVFMENVIANEIDHVSKYLKKDDLLYPCNAVGEQYKQQCYLMQTSYILKTLAYDFTKVFSTCARADSSYVATCYQSLGRDASGFTVSNPERTKAICLLGPDEKAQSNCVTGAVKDFISYHYSDVQALEFCRMLPNNLTDGCVSTTKSYYQTFTN